MSDRRHDLVLFGATGFTGRLVAEYLAEHAPAGLRWALAGRNESKVLAVRAEVGQAPARRRILDVPVLVADGLDARSLAELVPHTKVICTTVGPYAKLGRLLASMCAEHGTHYCDLTGEPPFMRASIDENHANAMRSRARIVHACGFDSIPSDLGTLLLWDHAKRVHGVGLSWVKAFAGPTKGGMSGGTVASMLNMVEDVKRDRSLLKLLSDPHALDPVRGGPRDPRDEDLRKARFDEDLGRWTAPFFMAVVNTRVVRRSHALLEGGYGKDFHYSEVMSFGKGAKGRITATAVTAGIATFVAAAALPLTRAVMQRTVLPAPGEGPSRETIEAGYFRWTLLADTEPDADGRTHRLRAAVAGTRDPGYGETSKMLGESAMCLAQDAEALPSRFGVLTPATAMGMTLVGRLRRAGMTFEILTG